MSQFTGKVLMDQVRYPDGDHFTLADTPFRLSLDIGCTPECDAFSSPLYEQLSGGGYDECSVLPIPETIHDWVNTHRTARKRSARARRLGYVGSVIQRHRYADDLYAINTSMEQRQGRPMTAGYHQRPSNIPDQESPCNRHGVHPYGVLHGDTLVAYLWVYRSGDLALVSSILGHGDHLANDVMYELFHTAMCAEVRHGGTFVYNRDDSGTEGLRFFKRRLGFEAREVEWRL